MRTAYSNDRGAAGVSASKPPGREAASACMTSCNACGHAAHARRLACARNTNGNVTITTLNDICDRDFYLRPGYLRELFYKIEGLRESVDLSQTRAEFGRIYGLKMTHESL